MNSKSAAVLLTADAKADDREQRLAELFDNHEARLYRLARRLAENADDAHDLVQETFVRAASSLRSIPVDPAKGEAWLVRVLVNIRRDQWRQTAVRRRSAATLAASSTRRSQTSNRRCMPSVLYGQHSVSCSRGDERSS